MKSPDNSLDSRIETLLKDMSLQEKISLLSGLDLWRTAAIGRLGIASLVMTDWGRRASKGPGDIYSREARGA
jgi:beta-glucosidase